MKKNFVINGFSAMQRTFGNGLGRLFATIGFRRNGILVKLLSGLLAAVVSVVAVFVVGVAIYAGGLRAHRWYTRRYKPCDNPYCICITPLSKDIVFHCHYDGRGYVYNVHTGEKLIKNIVWAVQPAGDDSLVCFMKDHKRGYFSKNTGRVIVEPKYDRAYVFSEGLAAVEEGGRVRFIDGTGNTVIDKGLFSVPEEMGPVFHDGYCVMRQSPGGKYGLMDKKGKIVLPQEYTKIIHVSDTTNLWVLHKDNKTAVLDQNLQTLLPLDRYSVYITKGVITVTKPDHTIQKYDMNGSLLNDFYISQVKLLEYETDQIRYHRQTHDEFGNEDAVPVTEPYHPKATAHLRSYTAAHCHQGLMTEDGHVVTMPLYTNIEAIGPDLYLCTFNNDDKLVVDGKGEVVR